MASEWQINRLPGMMAVKTIQEQFRITSPLAYQSTTSTNKRRQLWTWAEHRRLKSGPPLMRGQDIHKNIPVSVTILTLGLWVGFISSHLTEDKLFPVNPRAITGPLNMSLQLEAKIMRSVIILPRLMFVAHTDDLSWNIASNQHGQMFVQNLTRIVSKPNVTPADPVLHWRLY